MERSGILRNALICDGSGAEAFPGNLRFEQGIITEIFFLSINFPIKIIY